MAHSNKAWKPAKPYPDFPLFPHGNGQWAKKIRGRSHYFGLWGDWRAALEKYQDQRDDLHAGRTPRAKRDGLTVADLCNHFLMAKEVQRDAGEIVRSTFVDYLATCKLIIGSFGKNRLVVDLAADDFQRLRASLAKRLNSTTQGNEIRRIRTCFKHGYEAGLIEQPIRFGPTFKQPAKRLLRAERQNKGRRMFEAKELRRIIDAADQPLKAMILLGINCGFGNGDCGRLLNRDLNLNAGWVDFPRAKTSIDRRCPLWPETIETIRVADKQRPKPKAASDDHLVFVTKYGGSWFKETSDNPISKEMRKLLDELNLHRPGLGFYALRHTFETIGGGSRDQVAVNHIMGHADQSMAGVYREHIEDDRLVAVSDHVRNWLFPPKEKSAI